MPHHYESRRSPSEAAGCPDGIKKWAAAEGRQKCTDLMAKAFTIAYEYL